MRSIFLFILLLLALVGGFFYYAGYTFTGFTAGFSKIQTAPIQHLLFTGDIFLGRAVERWIEQTDSNPLQGIAPLLQSYSNVVINFEAAVPETHISTPNYTFRFSVASSALSMLSAVGVTHASLANNHAYDFGVSGFEHTKKALTNWEIQPFGDPTQAAPAISLSVDTTLNPIAVFGFSTVGGGYTLEAMAELVEAARTNQLFPIVYIHWGEEYVPHPSAEQVEVATRLAVAGAALIVGHHPHVVQSVAVIEETLVFYSLGNTVFDQYFSTAVQQGLLLGVSSDAAGYIVNLYPTVQYNTPAVSLKTDIAAEEFLRYLATISDPKLENVIKNGQIRLP